jgi:hypothetical protein
MTETLSISLGPAQTGLALKYQLIDSTGSNFGGEVTGGFTEIGVGNYMVSVTGLSDTFIGGIIVKKVSDSSVMGFGSLNPINLTAYNDIVGLRTDYTTGRAGNLDDLDATISSRSTLNASQIDSELSGVHGTGSWGSVSVGAIDTQLSGSHGAGSWQTSTLSAAQINTQLSGSHGTGSWENDITTSQIDAELSGVHGSGAWGPGTFGANTVIFTIKNTSNAVVPGVGLFIKSVDEQTTYVHSITDVNGQSAVHLDNGTYHVVLATSPLYDSFPSQTLVVNSSGAVTYTINVSTFPAPGDPDLSVIYDALTFADGSVASKISIQFILAATGPILSSNGSIVDKKAISVTTDVDGRFKVELYKASALTPKVSTDPITYLVTCVPCGINKVPITVPDSNVQLRNLLPNS